MSGENWPYPSFEINSDLKASRKFINENLNATIFGNARFKRWSEDSSLSPYGNYFLLDCGIVIKVGTLGLFYKIENVTNENIRWFNTMGWLGRNAMWGCKWIFYD